MNDHHIPNNQEGPLQQEIPLLNEQELPDQEQNDNHQAENHAKQADNQEIGTSKSCGIFFPLWSPVTILYYRINRNRCFLEDTWKLWLEKSLLCLTFWIDLYCILKYPYQNKSYCLRYVWNVFFIAVMDGLRFNSAHRKQNPVLEIGKDVRSLEQWTQSIHVDMHHVQQYSSFFGDPQQKNDTEALLKQLLKDIVEEKYAPLSRLLVMIFTGLATLSYILIWWLWSPEPMDLPSKLFLIRTGFVSFWIYWTVLSILFVEIASFLLCRVAFSKELTKMLSVNSDVDQAELFNILDVNSIRTWTNLTRILMSYGKPNIHQSKVYILVILILYVLRVSTFLGVSIVEDDVTTSFDTFWVCYGSFIIIVALIFGFIVWIESVLHDQWKDLINLPTEIETKLKDLQLHLPPEQRVAPRDELYNEIFERAQSIDIRPVFEALQTARRKLKGEKDMHERFFLGVLAAFIFFLFPLFGEYIRGKIFESFRSIVDVIVFILIAICIILRIFMKIGNF